MPTIRDAYVNVLLADASYAGEFAPGTTGPDLAAILTNRMTPTLAGYIGANFTVITQIGGFESSFDATVWQDRDGQTYVSMRGTLGARDISEDFQLTKSGLAREQLVDMVNWWLRATTPAFGSGGSEQYATQIRLMPNNDFGLGSALPATGELADISAIKSVNGHSLGGYLASAFVRLFGNQWHVKEINTFNSAGFSKHAATEIEDGFDQISQVIGTTLGLGVFSSEQNNYFALNGINVTTNTWDPIGFEQHGTRIGLFQEDRVTLEERGINNHYIYKLTDLLALGDALERLDANMSLDTLSTLVRAGSSQMDASYESVLDALRMLFPGDDKTPTLVGDASGGNNPQPRARIDFHEKLAALVAEPAFKNWAGKVTISNLVGMPATELATRAESPNGLAYRYALKTLMPFAVLGPDALYAQHNLSGDLGIYVDTAVTPVGMTEKYITDRAQMLAFLMTGNTNDTTAFASNQVSDQVVYSDLVKRRVAGSIEGEPTSLNVFMVSGTPNPRGPNTRVISFGTDGVDALQGRDNRDRLYGGKGADLLQGGKGDDYLEGGEGMDVYAYSAETSVFSPNWNDGDDEIRDTDRQGVILYTFTGSGTAGTSSHVIGGAAVQLDGTHWQSADGKFKFDQEGSDLRVRIDGDAGGSLLIRDFDFVRARQSESFGIRLVQTVVVDPTDTREFEGDRRILGSYFYVDPDTGAGEWRVPNPIPYDELGNVLRDPNLVLENVSDEFHGSPDSDGMYGRGGNDRLFGEDGDDLLLGGDGSDYIQGGEGNDVIAGHDPATPNVSLYDELHGGAGNDLIYAGAVQSLEDAFLTGGSTLIGDTSQMYGDAGDDILVGSSLGDFIHGGTGNDLIIGGANGDSLNGDDGDDVLYAGAGGASMVGGMGNDTLYADDDPYVGSFLNGGTNGYGPGDGDDVLIGSGNGRDTIQGGDGSDLVFAGGGNDTFSDSYWAYFAPDTIYMGEGIDSVDASHGDDFIDGGAGNDYLVGNGGDDAIYGGAGNDRLEGGWNRQAALDPGNGGPLTYVAVESGDDTLYGEEGDDALLGWEGDDTLIGDVGNDSLQGGTGDDWLDGGPGNDSLQGGPGGDIYVFDNGDGVDAVVDFDEGLPGQDSVFLGEGIAPEDLVLQASPLDTRLFVVLASGGDRMEIRSWYADEEGFGGEQFRIESFVFADGTSWDSAEIESKIVLGGPTPGRDQLAGTTGDDVIHALAGADQVTDAAGDDILFGDEHSDRVTDSEGHNLLVGGDGDDFLRLSAIPTYDEDGEEIELTGGSPGSFAIGGAGSDSVLVDDYSVVAYNAGDSDDSIRWVEGDVQLLTISLGGGISIKDISLSFSIDTSRLMVNFGPEFPPNEDGDPVPQEAIGLPNLSVQPDLWPSIVLQVIDEDVRSYDLAQVVEAYSAEVAQNPGTTRWSATQALQANLLGVSTTHATGGAIAYQYATTGTVDGLTPAQIRSVLTNANFGLAPQAIVPSAANSTPLLDNAIVDQSATEDAAFAFTVPAVTFSDPDAGDLLTYTAGLADGTALPAWLSFNTETRTFSGTPLQMDVGALDVAVTATDAVGLSAADTFALTVANVNDAPAVESPLADVSFEAAMPFSLGVPAGTFADEDPGDTLSLSATLFDGGALPAWLSFDAATAVFTGNPSVTDIGIFPIHVTAVDGAGAAAQSSFGLVVRVPAGAEATGSAGDDVIYGGTGDETLTAKGGSDYLFGDLGNDLLKGGAGNDVLQGGAGSDVLRGGKGQNVLDGGTGDDLIFGGAGSAFILGGAGNDTLRVGSGNDVIAFNAGDGLDTVHGGRDGGNTLSFGGGIRYADLSLSKSGKDLFVSAGGGEGLVLKNWYAGNHSVLNLQIVLDATEEFDAGSGDPLYNRRVQTFDFLGMVSAFDAARVETPGLTSWAMTNALLAFHLSGADDMALGGDLAYWYGKNRTLQGMSLQSAQQVIGAANFGSEAQSLRPFNGLQEGFAKLA